MSPPRVMSGQEVVDYLDQYFQQHPEVVDELLGEKASAQLWSKPLLGVLSNLRFALLMILTR